MTKKAIVDLRNHPSIDDDPLRHLYFDQDGQYNVERLVHRIERMKDEGRTDHLFIRHIGLFIQHISIDEDPSGVTRIFDAIVDYFHASYILTDMVVDASTNGREQCFHHNLKSYLMTANNPNLTPDITILRKNIGLEKSDEIIHTEELNYALLYPKIEDREAILEYQKGPLQKCRHIARALQVPFHPWWIKHQNKFETRDNLYYVFEMLAESTFHELDEEDLLKWINQKITENQSKRPKEKIYIDASLIESQFLTEHADIIYPFLQLSKKQDFLELLDTCPDLVQGSLHTFEKELRSLSGNSLRSKLLENDNCAKYLMTHDLFRNKIDTFVKNKDPILPLGYYRHHPDPIVSTKSYANAILEAPYEEIIKTIQSPAGKNSLFQQLVLERVHTDINYEKISTIEAQLILQDLTDIPMDDINVMWIQAVSKAFNVDNECAKKSLSIKNTLDGVAYQSFSSIIKPETIVDSIELTYE